MLSLVQAEEGKKSKVLEIVMSEEAMIPQGRVTNIPSCRTSPVLALTVQDPDKPTTLEQIGKIDHTISHVKKDY